MSFKFQDLEDWKEKELASYLLKLGFNCYKESGKLRKPIKTPIFMGLKNIHEACFVVDNPYWQGTVVKIRKNRAQQDLESEKLKKDFIRWKIVNVAIGNVFSNIFVRGGNQTVKTIITLCRSVMKIVSCLKVFNSSIMNGFGSCF